MCNIYLSKACSDVRVWDSSGRIFPCAIATTEDYAEVYEEVCLSVSSIFIATTDFGLEIIQIIDKIAANGFDLTIIGSRITEQLRSRYYTATSLSVTSVSRL